MGHDWVLEMFGAEGDEGPELPSEPRARFAALLGRLEEGLDLHALQREMEDELLAAYRARFPRSRPRIPEDPWGRWAKVRKLGEKFQEEFDEIVGRWRTDVEERTRDLETRKKAVEEELRELAETLEPESSGELRKVYEVGTYAYRTQGFGAAAYARGDARRHAAMLEMEGVEAEVREVPGSRDRWGIQSCEFEVWARCSELDHEIVKRRPAPPLKDQLQWCWDRGLNPRVFNPFLPHGLEEKLGVSFQPVREA